MLTPTTKHPKILNLKRSWKRIPWEVLHSEEVDIMTRHAIAEYMELRYIDYMQHCEEMGETPHKQTTTFDEIPSIWEVGPWDYTTSYYYYYGGIHKPKPTQPEWFALRHACHWIARPMLILAKAAYPDGDWDIYTGDKHSIVYDFRNARVWDVLLYRDKTTNSWEFANEEAEYP